MFSQFGIFNLGTPELLLIFLIVLLLFGGKKLPELARSAGSSVRELRKGLSEGGHEKNQKQTNEKARSDSAS
jgi:sec-independent protein translocase protein TatA